MKYYIYEKGKPKEVSVEEYEVWMQFHSEKYLLPDYIKIIDGNKYALETMYHGAFDKGEGVYPFVLLYFEDRPEVGEVGLAIDIEADEIEYFETFEEMNQQRTKRIAMIESIIPQS